jgi:hypothetical protein
MRPTSEVYKLPAFVYDWAWRVSYVSHLLLHTRVYPKVSGLVAWSENLRMVQLSATRCNCIAILWVSLVSFAAITLCVASQRVFIIIVVYFVIDSVRKLLDTPSYKCRVLGLWIAYVWKFEWVQRLHKSDMLRWNRKIMSHNEQNAKMVAKKKKVTII